MDTITDYTFKTSPLQHQREIFLTSRDEETWALFLEQGTGKTKIAIDTAAYLCQQGKINAVLVMCPQQVILNWTDVEFPIHCPDEVWSASKAVPWRKHYGSGLWPWTKIFPGTDDGLRVLAINPESLIQKDALDFCKRFCRDHNVLMVIDESQSIKTEGKLRTKAAMALKPLTIYRRIMTGTPIANNILDLYTQCNFLDEDIIGYSSYYAFKAHYAIQKKMQYGRHARPFLKVVGFRNVEELKDRLSRKSSRVLKSECLDLPAKIYQTRFVEMASDQERSYRAMKREAILDLEALKHRLELVPGQVDFETLENSVECDSSPCPPSSMASASHVAIKLLKLHQIASGWVMSDERKPVAVSKDNPKLKALLSIIADELPEDAKVTIWAAYRHDIDLITTALQDKYGADSAASFYGGMTREAKQAVVNGIQDPTGPLRFFVGNAKAGGSGITITQSHTVIYYGNSYNLIDRLQSEDRNHRIGQVNNVTYIDLVMKDTIDEKILKALQAKVDLAKTIISMDYREIEELLA